MLFVSYWNLFSFLRYQHIYPDSWVMWKNGFIRKLWLISKFVTSQAGQQIVINILQSDSRDQGNRAMKFGHLITYSVRNIFLQKSCRKWGGETSSRPLVFLKKLLRWKQVVSTLVYFGRPQFGHTAKINVTFQTVNPKIWSILIFYKRVWN